MTCSFSIFIAAMKSAAIRIMTFAGASLGWFAVIAQFYLLMKNSTVSVPETIFRFFGYFTIDSNILVALGFTFLFLQKNSRPGRFFTKATTLTAITVYITIVGIVYHVILRSTWNPQGLQKLVDELLHSIIPVLFILYWVFFVPVENLEWKHAFCWMIFPVIYMAYGLVHGAITKFYPYPFVNVIELGYKKALLNACGILLVIFFLSLALIGAGKIMKRFEKRKV
jgi:hypothetical protein